LKTRLLLGAGAGAGTEYSEAVWSNKAFDVTGSGCVVADQ
jgi:hypothetical protein